MAEFLKFEHRVRRNGGFISIWNDFCTSYEQECEMVSFLKMVVEYYAIVKRGMTCGDTRESQKRFFGSQSEKVW